MSSQEFGSFTLPLLLILTISHVFGHLFHRLRQPRVVGEVLAGICLGPSVLGQVAPALSNAGFALAIGPEGEGLKHAAAVGFLYNLGLLLLMFASGYEAKGLYRREDRREAGWLVVVGTAVPFVLVLVAAPVLPLESIIGSARQEVSLLIVIGIAAAVTSIPVIARIFFDLQVLHTRFARLVLSVAVAEDIVLWAVLAVATGLAAAGTLSANDVLRHVSVSVVHLALGLTLLPALARRITHAQWNVLARKAPEAYLVAILLAYSALAAAIGVNLVFAAFLAGYALAADDLLAESMTTLNRVSFAVFVPVYFALVGYQLNLSRTFSLSMVVAVFVVACALKVLSSGVAARLAGFSWPDSLNLSITLNARGGPGIVLASAAYEAQIINGQFYTALVLMAIFTSQVAGAWLIHVLRQGRPLLRETRQARTVPGVPIDEHSTV
jgi:Kef-type K+ transport system membrane component KefB